MMIIMLVVCIAYKTDTLLSCTFLQINASSNPDDLCDL